MCHILCAGVMVSSLSVLMTANKFPVSSCMQLALCVLVLWTTGLYLFWYILIPSKDEGKEGIDEGGQSISTQADIRGGEGGNSQHGVSAGWTQKVKTRDGDLRLPTTIITGFLVRLI